MGRPAWSLAYSDPPQLEQALQLANRALERTPERAEFRETRGQILAKLERWEEAIADLEKALARMQDRDELRETLAQAYEAIGRVEIAAGHRAAMRRPPSE